MGIIEEPEVKELHTDMTDMNLETDDVALRTHSDLPNVEESTPVYVGEMTLQVNNQLNLPEDEEPPYVR